MHRITSLIPSESPTPLPLHYRSCLDHFVPCLFVFLFNPSRFAVLREDALPTPLAVDRETPANAVFSGVGWVRARLPRATSPWLPRADDGAHRPRVRTLLPGLPAGWNRACASRHTRTPSPPCALTPRLLAASCAGCTESDITELSTMVTEHENIDV